MSKRIAACLLMVMVVLIWGCRRQITGRAEHTVAVAAEALDLGSGDCLYVYEPYMMNWSGGLPERWVIANKICKSR